MNEKAQNDPSLLDEDTISIIIPALNEERSIGKVVGEIPGQIEGKNVEIIVVNDGSKDRTADEAARAGATVVNHYVNRGYGAALKSGFRAARGSIIAFLDADGTYPPRELGRLYAELINSRSDVVVASRFAGAKSRMPLHRKFGNRILSFLVRWLTRAKVTDSATGFRIFKKDILEKIYPLSDNMDLTPEMTVKAVMIGLKYREIPIEYHERSGESKLRAFSDGYRFFNTIVRIVRDYDPMRIFGPIGLFSILTGLVFIGFVVWDFAFHRKEHTFILILSIIALSLGIQLLLFGFLADMILNRQFRRETDN